MSKKGEEKQKKGEVSLKFTRAIAPYAPKKQLGTYVLRRWNWREKSRATGTATVKIDRKAKIIKFDQTIYYEQMMLITVRKAPKGLKWNLATVQKLDPDVGDTLQQACLEVNTLSKEDREGFLGQLSSGIPIPGSPPTGSAKPSELSPNPGE